jgi:polyisoprenoid-binding protein YceI
MQRAASMLSVLLLSALAHADAAEWKLDTSHSKIGFKVPHLVVSSVEGRFKEATASIKLNEADLTKSSAAVEISAASIDTADQKRDDHLRSPDFFDVKKYPKLKFKSTKVSKSGAGYKLSGDLTIRDVTRPLTLDATLSAPVKTPFGTTVRGAKLSGKLNRSDFGLKWNKALEAGGVVVGEEVTLDIQAEVMK